MIRSNVPSPTDFEVAETDGQVVVLLDEQGRFRAHRMTLADRAVARLRSRSLDTQLSAGTPPEANRLLATRAHILVQPRSRRLLANDLQHLSEVACSGPPQASRRPRICRTHIVESLTLIDQVVDLLWSRAPIAARGVAMTSRLLSDGTGPVYNPSARPTLLGALTRVIESLEPAMDL
jgi:hypothetical protein